MTVLAVAAAEVGRGFACEGSRRPPKMSWRRARGVGERVGLPSALKGCDEVEEGSGGS